MLCETCSSLGRRGWCRATGGNFSLKIDAAHCLITQSGKDKSALEVDDLMICTLQGIPINKQVRPSAETALHVALYQLDPGIAAVLHTHSVAATVVSRHHKKQVVWRGFEMQKAIRGVSSHEDSLSIPIFDNSQDMTVLVRAVDRAWRKDELMHYGFLIRGHGLYAWGRSITEARRHIEGLEFLLECSLQETWVDRQ